MSNIQAGVNSMLRRRSGFTLLELVFVITVIIALIVLSIAQYQRYTVSKDLELVRYNVDKVFQAANQCYWKNRNNNPGNVCSSSGTSPYPMPVLLLNNNKLTPNQSNYSFSIAQISGTGTATIPANFLVTVSVTFPNVANAAVLSWYASKLNATAIASTPPNTLSWNRVPTYSTPTAGTNLWINNAQLQQFRNLEQPPPSKPSL